MTAALNGQCLCGGVKFAAIPAELKMGICHCGMCRRWTGGVFMSVNCADTVAFESDDNVGSYKGTAWGERLFCKSCGSTILWQTQDGNNQHVSIQAFDDPAVFEFDSQIFIDKKPANYDFANDTKCMTEAEIFAMFAPKEGDTGHG